ncbi:ROK family transcriptional regulator [Thalassococcus lentus]|uniref:ROK family transcriptional regulator n=1 Tax=Thalassococcus lentus TaxID=1210524 RepID=A0ABT4XSE1_9RHOB|nr:ROK family transcriptional regulator [Thalassococcus lentus]MDA7424840.1 ROK family transcriptional regulator [Thalassococcus lentus]
MRAHNERLVLTLLRRHGPMAKADIARSTGLSAQTVSVIMRALEGDGLLERGDPIRGKVGQPSVPMALAAGGAYFLGLKIGRRSVELVLTDFKGQVLDRATRVHAYPEPKATVKFAVSQIEALLADLPDDQRTRVAGLGIAMPFFLWNWAAKLNVAPERMEGWRDFDIRAEIAAAFDFPVFLQNDASAACGAELVFGPQDGARDFLYFYVGYFIGGGLALDGKLFTGRGNAAALGPLPVPDGKGGTCQLIDLASLGVLEATLLSSGFETSSMWINTEDWRVDEAMLEDWLNSAADALAYAVVSASAVLDVEAVRIDGWLPDPAREALVSKTQAALARNDTTGLTLPRIEAGHVGSDARTLGGASLPLSHRFLIE